jgi:hypothetical protein
MSLDVDRLSEQELAQLTDAAVGMLGVAGEGPHPAEVLNMPDRVLRRQLHEAALDEGLSEDEATRLAEVATEPSSAPVLARAVLSELQKEEALAEELESAYARRGDLMAIDPLTLTAGALLLVALRIKTVKVSRQEGLTIEFHPLKASIVSTVLGVLGGQAS